MTTEKTELEASLEKQLADALKKIEVLEKKLSTGKGSVVPKGKRRVFIVPAQLKGDYSTRVVDGLQENYVTLRTNGAKFEIIASKQVDIDESIFIAHEDFLAPFEVK